MASNFPKLPGYVPTHDPTNVNHKKVSHVKLEEIRNAKNVVVPLHALPRQIERNFLPEKTQMDKSLSHTQYPNHLSEDKKEIQELFEPTFVKLDKQVSCNPFETLKNWMTAINAAFTSILISYNFEPIINYYIGLEIFRLFQRECGRIKT